MSRRDPTSPPLLPLSEFGEGDGEHSEPGVR
jgi:hypothetical protein